MTAPVLLDSLTMARFVARGFLRLDAVVPEEINRRFLADTAIDRIDPSVGPGSPQRKVIDQSAIPEILPGTTIEQSYPAGTPIGDLLRLPAVRGAIQSLVGADAELDSHYLHVTWPPTGAESAGSRVSQANHQDSTIDPQAGFDIQIMYYPHEVTPAMGGTRFVPGTHLRIVNEFAVGRYQNMLGQQHVVCPAGTLLFLHHGIWHGGGLNNGDRARAMFKIRLSPTRPQVRLWEPDPATLATRIRPLFFLRGREPESVESILLASEPWFELDTHQLEYLQRIKLWRRLIGDDKWDVDFWMTRLENPARR